MSGNSNYVEVIAEAAQGYEGSLTYGLLLVMAAARGGADAVKFQICFADDVTIPGQRHYEEFKAVEMSEQDWKALRQAAREAGLLFFADLSGSRALAMAKKTGPDGVKVHATNFYNHALVTEALRQFPRLYVSVGGIRADEIAAFIERHQPDPAKITFLYGFQSEPTPLELMNLLRLRALRERFPGFSFGFMDHVAGGGPDRYHVPVLAMAAGARVIEKHLTLNRFLGFEDSVSALEPEEFGEFVRLVRRMEGALGSSDLEPNEAELTYRAKVLKKVVATRPLPAGTRVEASAVDVKRVQVSREGFFHDVDRVIGHTLVQDVKAHEPICSEDLR